MQKRPSQDIVPSQGGMLKDALLRIKLTLRLIADGRVSIWLKLLPIAGVAYLFFPFDIAPDVMPILGQLDDVGILLLANHFFIEFCPPDVLREHVKNLTSNNDIIEEDRNRAEGDVVDGETTDLTDWQ
jgi:uncharacterized membrane protein YkvA (DUF1232 family)